MDTHQFLNTLKPYQIKYPDLLEHELEVYSPNLNAYIDHLKTLTNSMSKIQTIYVWTEGQMRVIDAWEWFSKNRNLGDVDVDPTAAFSDILLELSKFTDLINQHPDTWTGEGNNRKLHYIKVDTIAFLELLQLSIEFD
jgi:hypothetical protein